MRILLATNTTPVRGGVSSVIAELAAALRSLGHEVDVVTVFGRSNRAVTVPRSVFSWLSLPLRTKSGLAAVYLATREVLRLQAALSLRRRPYDLIHAQDFCAVNALAGLAARQGIPLLLTVHGCLRTERVAAHRIDSRTALGRFLLAEERRAMSRADHVMVVSGEARQYVLAITGGRGNISLIGNLVDTDRFQPRPEAGLRGRRSLDIGRADFVVLYSGRLVGGKGVGDALEALAFIPGCSGRRVFLVIAGDGPERQGLEAKGRTVSHGCRVIFLGEVAPIDMPGIYNLADVLVVPSVSEGGTTEGAPMVVLEAFASGVPVVASRIGGLPEMITDGETGFLVPEGSPRDLAEALERLLGDPALRLELGRRARAVAETTFGAEGMGRRFASLYAGLIARRRPREPRRRARL